MPFLTVAEHHTLTLYLERILGLVSEEYYHINNDKLKKKNHNKLSNCVVEGVNSHAFFQMFPLRRQKAIFNTYPLYPEQNGREARDKYDYICTYIIFQITRVHRWIALRWHPFISVKDGVAHITLGLGELGLAIRQNVSVLSVESKGKCNII